MATAFGFFLVGATTSFLLINAGNELGRLLDMASGRISRPSTLAYFGSMLGVLGMIAVGVILLLVEANILLQNNNLLSFVSVVGGNIAGIYAGFALLRRLDR